MLLTFKVVVLQGLSKSLSFTPGILLIGTSIFNLGNLNGPWTAYITEECDSPEPNKNAEIMVLGVTRGLLPVRFTVTLGYWTVITQGMATWFPIFNLTKTNFLIYTKNSKYSF